MNSKDEQKTTGQSDSSVTNDNALRRVDTCANTSIWGAAIAWGSFILFIIFGIIDSSSTFLARAFDGICIPIFYIMIFTNLVSLFSGIIGLIRTIIKRKKSSGTIRASVAIMLSLALFAIVIPAIQVRPRDHRRLVCANNQKCLAMAIVLYSENHNYTYPTPEHWCDLLAQRKDVYKKFFVCPTALYKGDKGPCHYSLNPNCEPNSPKDTVLLFETKGGWNQHGGLELLTFDNHRNGCWIAFNDGHVEFIKPEDIGKLRWKVEANEMNQPASH